MKRSREQLEKIGADAYIELRGAQAKETSERVAELESQFDHLTYNRGPYYEDIMDAHVIVSLHWTGMGGEGAVRSFTYAGHDESFCVYCAVRDAYEWYNKHRRRLYLNGYVKHDCGDGPRYCADCSNRSEESHWQCHVPDPLGWSPDGNPPATESALCRYKNADYDCPDYDAQVGVTDEQCSPEEPPKDTPHKTTGWSQVKLFAFMYCSAFVGWAVTRWCIMQATGVDMPTLTFTGALLLNIPAYFGLFLCEWARTQWK